MSIPLQRKLISAIGLILSCLMSQAQITYTWSGPSGGSWVTAGYWTPNRMTPAANDIIQFNDGGTYVVTGVPTQTIGRLLITGNSSISLQAGTTNTLSVNGPGTSNNLVVENGSSLQLGAAGTLTLNIVTTANQRGDISGTLTVASGTFSTSNVATTIVTVSSTGSIINLNGTVTGSAATLVFSPGASYQHQRNTGTVPAATWTNAAPYPTCSLLSPATGPTGGLNQAFGNLVVGSGAAVNNNMTGAVTINGDLQLNSGNFGLQTNTLTLNGNLSVSSGQLVGGASANLIIAGSAGNLTLPAISGGLRNLTVNRAAGISLGAPLNMSTTGVLTLTSGIISCSGNLLTLANTAAAAVSGGSATSYVNGPVSRALPASLASGSTYLFPVGKSTYTPFELINPTTAAAGSIRVEVFDADAGGLPGFGLASLNTNRYWQATPSGAWLTGTAVRLTDPGWGSANRVAQCSSVNGTYFNCGGSAPSPIQSIGVDPGLNYFVMGTASAITLSGTYTVGASGTFNKLTHVANALNTITVTSDVLFELLPDYDGTSGEAFPITFNAFTCSGGSWNAEIRPAAGATARVTSGDAGSGNPLFVFNGTDRITLDGRTDGNGTDINWTLRNSRTASSVGPAIQFTSGATYDTLRYLRIESQNSTSTSGTIYISSYPGWSAGNHHLNIENCDITRFSSGSTTHVNAIYAYGQTANPNSYVSILDNNIHSFTPGLNYEASGVTVTGTGINTNYGDHWTISGNSFYLDCAEQQYHRYTVINLIPGLGSGSNLITGNFIGGSAPACGGAAWTSAVGGAGNTIQTFEGIYIWAGATDITHNVIQNISLTATGGTSFGAIHLASCSNSATYNISNNMIGSDSVCNSIRNAGQWKTVGMWIDNTCGTVNITNNIIANITETNAVNSAAAVTGIYTDCGNNNITGNVVFNLTAATAAAAAQLYIAHDASVVGIANKSIYSGTTQNISNNTIYALRSTYSGANNNKLYGIYTSVGEPGQVHTYNGNTIFAIEAPNTSNNARITGLGAVGSSWSSAVTSVFSNNMIHLGMRTDGSSITSGAEITGILDNTSGYTSGANTTYMNYYYNSVYITGSGITGTTNNTYAFRRNNTNISPKNTLDIRSNIFVNQRSNSTGTRNHYALYFDNSNTITCNDNILWGSGTGHITGNSAAVNYAGLAAWQGGTGFDLNSLSSDPLFMQLTMPPDLHLQGGSPAIGAGTSCPVTDDFDGQARTNPCDAGADEYNAAYSLPGYTMTACGGAVPLPVELLQFEVYCDDSGTRLEWITASENENDYFTLEKGADGQDWKNLATIAGGGTQNTISAYAYSDPQSGGGTVYYRLMQTDYDGQHHLLGIRSVSCGRSGENRILQIYPNPCSGELRLLIPEETGKCSRLLITHPSGAAVMEWIPDPNAQKFLTLDVKELPEGIYFICLETTDARYCGRFVRH